MAGFGLILMFFELLFGAITSLDIFVLGIAFVCAGIVLVYTNRLEYSLVTIAITCIVYSVYLKQAIHKKLLLFIQTLGIDCVIGKTGTVVQEVAVRKKGSVFFDGELWEAFSADNSLSISTRVVVIARTKNTLTVTKLIPPNQVV